MSGCSALAAKNWRISGVWASWRAAVAASGLGTALRGPGRAQGVPKYASHLRQPMAGDHSRPYGVVLRSRHGPSRPSQPRPPTAAGSAEAGRLPTRHARAYNLEIASLKGDTMSVARPGRKLLASA